MSICIHLSNNTSRCACGNNERLSRDSSNTDWISFLRSHFYGRHPPSHPFLCAIVSHQRKFILVFLFLLGWRRFCCYSGQSINDDNHERRENKMSGQTFNLFDAKLLLPMTSFLVKPFNHLERVSVLISFRALKLPQTASAADLYAQVFLTFFSSTRNISTTH